MLAIEYELYVNRQYVATYYDEVEAIKWRDIEIAAGHDAYLVTVFK